MKRFAPVSLIVVAMLSGCALVFPKETRTQFHGRN